MDPAPAAAGRETPFADIVLEVLRTGPLTGFETARAIQDLWPGFLGGREGCLYPVLLELRREGRVRSWWSDEPEGRRRVYAATEGPTEEPSPDADVATATATMDSERDESPPLVPTPSPTHPGASERAPLAGHALRALADRATRKLGFAPRLAEETRVEILHHLLDAAATYEVSGMARADAEARAAKALGDPWKIATDLRRGARGQRTIIFPTTRGESLLGVVIYDLRVLLLIVAAILFVRFQVITAYHIPTKSMEPTLHGDLQDGDRILVSRFAGPPDRWDIYVFDGWAAERKNFVKRCLGQPGERIAFFEGDLWVDDRLVRKDGAVYEALLFDIFDRDTEQELARQRAERGDVAAAEDTFLGRLREKWTRTGGEWAEHRGLGLRVRVADGAEPAELAYHEPIEDAYIDAQSQRLVSGRNSVPDMRLTLDVRPEPAHAETGRPDARVAIRLTRGDAHYDAVLIGDRPGVSLEVDGVEVARADGVSVPPGATTRVSFSQVDRVLRLAVGDELVLRHDLDVPEFPKKDAAMGEALVRVARGGAWLNPIRLERDVYYTPEYNEVGTGVLGADEFFMVGDNAWNSQDSRAKGPVHRSRLVGAPLVVVWPLSRVFYFPR